MPWWGTRQVLPAVCLRVLVKKASERGRKNKKQAKSLGRRPKE